MENKLSKKEMEDVRKLVDCALDSYSKDIAKPYLSKLIFMDRWLSNTIFSEMVSAVNAAVGNIKDKDDKVKTARELLTKVEIFCAFSDEI